MAGTWGRVIGGQHAFVWSNGSFTDLGTLGGLTTTANAINAAGQVVGTSSASYCCDLEYDPVCECYVTVLTPNCIGANPLHAFGGGMTDLGPGGCDGSSFAYGNNDSGQIVGEWRASTSQGAAVWAGGGPTIIGPGVAYDINNAGQVVGETGVFGTPTRAGLWDSGGWTQLYGGTSAARAINDVGQVVGSAYYDPYPPSSPYEGTYITVWEGGMMRVYDHGTAYDINNSGEFVGSHLFDGTFYAKTSWLGWTVGDINGMVKSQFRWAHIITATGINDSGDIVGTGVRQQGGPARAFLMTKCDSPHAASPDCDGNGVFDGCDIVNGTSRDCDFSGVPDECETLADCNANGAPDACDILDGASRDCDNSGVPDECESLPDCNNNGMPDACDIADETSQDCDLNGVPDECDPDFDGDGIPDACEVVITDVSSQFVSPSKAKVFFLDGVSLSETFTATVNWQGNTPSAVRFITPQGTFSGSGSGTTWTYALDMGSDFGQGGLLTVQAESTDGATSPPYVVNLKVVAPPIGMVPAFLSAQPSGGTLKYVTPSVSGGQDLVVEAGVGPGTITSTIPLFGSEEFAFGSVFKLSAEVSGDGSASGMFLNLEFPSNQHKTKMAGFKFRPKVTGTATWQFDDAANQWAPGGRVTFGGTVGADVPPVPVQFLVLGIPAYWRGHIDVGLTAGLDLMSWTAPGQPVWNGTLSLDPFP
ncbi:MAG: hypothetical protein ACE5GE_16060, partial [Phycisphaerae bacterium]